MSSDCPKERAQSPRIVKAPNSITRLLIPPDCPITAYEETLLELFESGFPVRTTIENTSCMLRWELNDVKEHIKRVSEHASKLTAKHRVAIVATDSLGYGQGKMAQGNLALIFPCEIEVFENYAPAERWLLEER